MNKLSAVILKLHYNHRSVVQILHLSVIFSIFTTGVAYSDIREDYTLDGKSYKFYLTETTQQTVNNNVDSTSYDYSFYNGGILNVASGNGVTITYPAGIFLNTGDIISGKASIVNSSSVTNLYNSGSISNGIDNNSSQSVIGIIQNSGAIFGSISGAGIVNRGEISLIENSGSLRGSVSSISNAGSGHIFTLRNLADGEIGSDGYGVDNSGRIELLTNAGNIVTNAYSAIDNIGAIDSIDNTGVIKSSLAAGVLNDEVIGSISTSGKISGINGIENEANATINEINNSGTISGTKFAILNNGLITNGIKNTGTLNGNVVLNTSSLYLLGNSAYVSGNITGGNVSHLYIGADSITSNFTSEGNVSVGGIIISNGSQLNLKEGNIWSATQTGTLNEGTILTYGDITLNGVVQNNGEIILNTCTTCAGNTLVINGDYAGSLGGVSLGTVLGGDDSLTDKLVINGDASGVTRVNVTNENGEGAQTVKGIEIITTQSSSPGSFIQGGRIIAGAYDYELVQKGSNWYLTSTQQEEEIPNEPDEGTDQGSGSGEQDENEESATRSLYRPEAGVYIANNLASNTLFTTRMHDRVRVSRDGDSSTGMWIRNEGGHTRSRDTSGSLKSQSNRYVFQLGSDILTLGEDNVNKFHLGLMGGYARQHTTTRNTLIGYSASGAVEGYSVGPYATWYQNEKNETGWYVDSWLLYNWFDSSVKGEAISSTDYKSNGLTASFETGYTLPLSPTTPSLNYYLQPVAQVIWMDVNSDEFNEAGGADVQTFGDGNIRTRLGVRAYIKGYSKVDMNTERVFEPFIEANWIHDTHEFGVKMNDVSLENNGAKNIAELRAGIESRVSGKFNLWGHIGQQMGNHGYSDTSAQIGLKVLF